MDIKKYKSHDKILVAVDCIIFGFDGKEIKALFIKRGFHPEKGKWSLMGGFVSDDESVDEAAARVLKQLTGLTNIYMEQLYCFGNVDRDLAGRVMSVAYFSLIKITDYSEQLSSTHEACWFPVRKMPKLIFDHARMVQMAKERLQQKASHYPIGFELLPHKFTLQQLQSLYEGIYERTLDRRNFTKKVLSLNILKKLNEKEKESSRKGAFYFVFDRAKYNKLQHEGIKFL
jgi:ADP-ribose pyrophosphatase YjhB (NUDIX family)